VNSQPVPSVSQADIDRVVRREFAAAHQAAAWAALEAYGIESHEREVVRVRLAALKLAKGSLAELTSPSELGKVGLSRRDRPR
jgi:hypothetical protein